MQVPVMAGLIERRILVNYRVAPEALVPVLPAPFRPKLVGGFGMAGICLIRLGALRPRGLPGWMGLHSENAAHRVAVEWEEGGATREGVFIPRRDTSSRLSTLVGGTLFPGEHHHAHFAVVEAAGNFEITMQSDDEATWLHLRARRDEALPSDSLFSNLPAASRFFQRGATGYSATHGARHLDGLELRTSRWEVTPLGVESVHSSFFDDETRFPAGAATFDNALLMQGIPHEWHARAPLPCAPV